MAEEKHATASNASSSPAVISEQPGPHKGIFGRAVDSFKPPVGQKGYLPELSHGYASTTTKVSVQEVRDEEKARNNGEVVDEAYDDNGGLKRKLHGRHLQVCWPRSLLSLILQNTHSQRNR